MKFKLEISTDNAAFEESRELETARILREVADNLERGHLFDDYTRLFDINGNTVGTAKFKGR